jgi:sugar/nucleoside kinase (ribokinase family)
MNTPELRKECAARLEAGMNRCAGMKAFVGFDGFVDNILRAVGRRDSPTHFEPIPTITKFAERIAGAAGKSTNIEFVTQMVKLGGNGPIMANALASFGMKVSYLGNLGYPKIHPCFQELANRAEVNSILDPGTTDAVEFEDGKIMFGKIEPIYHFNWKLIQERFGAEKFAAKIAESDFVAPVNWTMYPGMNEIWSVVLRDICPKLKGPRKRIFFDLADPEKRSKADIAEALRLIAEFEKYFDVILGLNEKESSEIGHVLGLNTSDHSPEGLLKVGEQIMARVPLNTLVIHPVTYALALSRNDSAIVQGPHVPKPKITTGGGDHFNAGFCLGKLLGLNNAMSVLTGVTTSGFYVSNAKTPTISDLIGMMKNWPQ